MKSRGSLFVLVGPSGSGKNRIMGEVLQHQNPGTVRQLATATTRPKRENETEGVEHLFISEAQFKELIEQNALIEYQLIHGERYYGTPRAEVERILSSGEDRIADIDVLGAQALKAAFPDDVTVIFISPPDHAALETRIRARASEPEQEIQTRLQRADMEMSYALKTDYIIVNDDIESAAHLLSSLMEAEIAGQPIEATLPNQAHLWITPLTAENKLLTENNHLICLPVPDRENAIPSVQAILQTRWGIETETVSTLPNAIWYRHEAQQNRVDLLIQLRALHLPADAPFIWRDAQDVEMPYHIRAALLNHVAMFE